MFCVHCGAGLSSDDRFCTKCGTAQSPGAPVEPLTRDVPAALLEDQNPEPPEWNPDASGSTDPVPAGRPYGRRNLMPAVLAIAALVVLAGAAYFVYRRVASPSWPSRAEINEQDTTAVLETQPSDSQPGSDAIAPGIPQAPRNPTSPSAPGSLPPVPPAQLPAVQAPAHSDVSGQILPARPASQPRPGLSAPPVIGNAVRPQEAKSKLPRTQTLQADSAPPAENTQQNPLARDEPAPAISAPSATAKLPTPGPSLPSSDASASPQDANSAQTASSAENKGPRKPLILLPGSQAYNPPPISPPANSATPNPAGLAPPSPSAAATPTEGIIFWTGKLQKNKVVVIDAGTASLGLTDGSSFPGLPVDVRLPSPAVAIVERPGPENGWKRVAFRCLRNTDRNVTINIQWFRTR